MARIDVYTGVTQRIIADLEKGVRPWRKPWSVVNAEGSITQQFPLEQAERLFLRSMGQH